MNKRELWTPILFTIVLVLFVVCYSNVSKADNMGELESQKKENEESQSIYEQQASELRESEDVLESIMSGLNEDLEEINHTLSELESKISVKQEDISRTQTELEEVKEQESKQYAGMKKRIQYMFELGKTDYVEILMSGGSIADNLNQAEFISELVKYDRGQLDEYKKTKLKVTENESVLLEEQLQLEDLQTKANEQKELLLKKITDTNAQIVQVASSMEEAERIAFEYEKQVEQAQLAIDDESRRIEESSIIEQERIERESREREKRERESREQASREQASREQASREQASREQESGNQGSEEQPNDSTETNEDETTSSQEQETTKKPDPPSYVPGESDLDYLAALIECEAGDQSYYGMLCVGAVVMNRIESSRFPNTLYEVLYQPYQFSPVTVSGRFAIVLERGAKPVCYQAAKEVLDGNVVGSWLFFRMNDGSREGEIIGDHVFY